MCAAAPNRVLTVLDHRVLTVLVQVLFAAGDFERMSQQERRLTAWVRESPPSDLGAFKPAWVH
jgi:hypothetical protein